MSDSVKFGETPPEDAGRDAVHIAIVPVKAAQILGPGDHVGLMPGSTDEVAYPRGDMKAIGIVDPFLSRNIEVGDRVWLLLYPQTITGLRHVWTHPAFPMNEPPRQASAAAQAAARHVIEQFGYEPGWDFDQTMDNLTRAADSGETWFGLSVALDLDDELWNAWEILSGRTACHRVTYFSCAC